ncbi:MAG TPA: signal peptidase II [Opitutae bacterium]|nr:signal peptidase II [Opitutae bacterium]|tara:strand:+ start:4540 stop:5061 length:522 start_codon:yes stop_codon:yes gene_type:complete
MKKYIPFWVLFALVVTTDQWSKSLVVENSKELQENPIVILELINGRENLLEFTYITNPGAAWSMFSDYPEALTLLALTALISIFFFRKALELNKILHQYVFGLIAGGIAGNLGDRLFRDPAEVVDFIDFFLPVINYDYPIFNIADSAIFVGAFSYIIIGIVEAKNEKELQRVT